MQLPYAVGTPSPFTSMASIVCPVRVYVYVHFLHVIAVVHPYAARGMDGGLKGRVTYPVTLTKWVQLPLTYFIFSN